MFHTCICVSQYRGVIGIYRGSSILSIACTENIQSTQLLGCIRLPTQLQPNHIYHYHDSSIEQSYSRPIYVATVFTRFISICFYSFTTSLHIYIYQSGFSAVVTHSISPITTKGLRYIYIYIYIYPLRAPWACSPLYLWPMIGEIINGVPDSSKGDTRVFPFHMAEQ